MKPGFLIHIFSVWLHSLKQQQQQSSVLQIRRGKQDNFHYFFKKYVAIHHEDRLAETVLMWNHNIHVYSIFIGK